VCFVGVLVLPQVELEHCCSVYTEFDLRPVKLQQIPRTIPLYNKANWHGMKIDLQNIKKTLSNMFKDNDCQVTNMWNVFKETITKSAVKHIPQKRTKVKDSRPWINTEIRKNLRKLQRIYKQKQNFFNPECGSSSFGVTIFSIYFQYDCCVIF
jgi:beta-xylosidase